MATLFICVCSCTDSAWNRNRSLSSKVDLFIVHFTSICWFSVPHLGHSCIDICMEGVVVPIWSCVSERKHQGTSVPSACCFLCNYGLSTQTTMWKHYCFFQVLKPSNTLLNRLSRLLKLTTAEDVTFSLVLRRHSSKPEIVSIAKQHLKKRFLDLVQCYLDAGMCYQV